MQNQARKEVDRFGASFHQSLCAFPTVPTPGEQTQSVPSNLLFTARWKSKALK